MIVLPSRLENSYHFILVPQDDLRVPAVSVSASTMLVSTMIRELSRDVVFIPCTSNKCSYQEKWTGTRSPKLFNVPALQERLAE
jgi:hypothetical protein